MKSRKMTDAAVTPVGQTKGASTQEKISALEGAGFTVGNRDERLNTNYPGMFMVVEAHEESELPTKDGSNGPWCVVGDDLPLLVDLAFAFLESCNLDAPALSKAKGGGNG